MVIVDVRPAVYLLILLGLASTVFLPIISVSNVCGLNARTFPARSMLVAVVRDLAIDAQNLNSAAPMASRFVTTPEARALDCCRSILAQSKPYLYPTPRAIGTL
jgi:hypothetical protein